MRNFIYIYIYIYFTFYTHIHTYARAVLVKNIASYGNRKIVTLIKIDKFYFNTVILSLKFKIKINARNIKIFISQSRAGMI